MSSFTAPSTSAVAPVLVIGASGKTGRRVASRLRVLGIAVRQASRATSPSFDWHDERTWDRALAGVGAVYLTFAPDLAVSGAAEIVGRFALRARVAGVERIVVLSGRGEPGAQRAEEAVRASGVDVSVVRCSWFAQNFSESFLLDPVRGGVVALPVTDVREPFVDLEDVADVAVTCLTEDGHAGQTYELTGPEALTFTEAVASIAAATGRPIAFVPITLQAFTDELLALGVPSDEVDLLRYLFSEVLDGRNAATTDGVRLALGRDPRPFAAYVEDARERWALDGAVR